MQPRKILAIFVAVAIALSVGPVEAKKNKRKKVSSTKKLAKEHFNKAQAKFNMGQFEEALEHYTKAYELTNLSGFIFNIAQCHRYMKDYDKARFFYRRYLQYEPNADNAQVVQELIRECDNKVAEAAREKREAREAELKRIGAAAKATEGKRLAEERKKQEALAASTGQTKSLVVSASDPSAGPKNIMAVPPSGTAASQGGVEDGSSPFYKKWWFWTIVGGVVVAAGTGAAVVASSGGTGAGLPSGDLQPIDVR